jgi:hypothetical protein
LLVGWHVLEIRVGITVGMGIRIGEVRTLFLGGDLGDLTFVLGAIGRKVGVLFLCSSAKGGKVLGFAVVRRLLIFDFLSMNLREPDATAVGGIPLRSFWSAV